MKTIKINDLSDLKKAMDQKNDSIGYDPICDEFYQTICKTCSGAGGYYEDVAGDGGSRMFMPCEDCEYENNN